MRLFAAALLALGLAAPAAAEDCGKYDEPLAYNSCLARQGPAARAVHTRAAPVGGPQLRPAARTRVTQRRGRSEMVFSVHR